MEKQANSIMSSSSPSAAPTTFVQADATTFRELVQKLTGASDSGRDTTGINKLPSLLTHPSNSRLHTKPVDPKGRCIRRSPFKLQERRQTIRKLEIKLGLTSLRSPPSQNNSPTQIGKTHHAALFSPVPSPVTPLFCDSAFAARAGTESPPSEEERAISKKGFYLHPSPRKSVPPELLSLFPLTSPRQQYSQQDSR